MGDFYRRDEHGPTEVVALNKRYCYLAGGYILCPALRAKKRGGFDCAQFPGALGKPVKNSLFGMLGSKLPVAVPQRAKACIKLGCYVSLMVGHSGMQTTEESPSKPRASKPRKTKPPKEL